MELDAKIVMDVFHLELLVIDEFGCIIGDY